MGQPYYNICMCQLHLVLIKSDWQSVLLSFLTNCLISANLILHSWCHQMLPRNACRIPYDKWFTKSQFMVTSYFDDLYQILFLFACPSHTECTLIIITSLYSSNSFFWNKQYLPSKGMCIELWNLAQTEKINMEIGSVKFNTLELVNCFHFGVMPL